MDVAPPAVNPDTLTRNLAALKGVGPELADVLARPQPEEEHYCTARARDGQLSFRRTGDDGQVQWFARSSIPYTRAVALLEQFAPGNGNVLLPGMAAGYEARILCERLGAHRAVFVWEASPLSARLALRLHDLSEAIAQQRLIPIVCPLESLAALFVDWLRAHPGHLCPERLLMYPWQSYAELAGIRSVIESVHRETESERAEALAKVEKVGVAAGESERPSVGLLSLNPRDVNWAILDGLASAARSLGGSASISDIRTPADMHPLARARRLLGGPLQAAILLDIPRGDVSDLLPEPLPVVSWLTGQMLPDTFTGRMGKSDTLAVASGRVADLAVEAGLQRERIVICPPPCLADTEVRPDAPRDIDIAVFADLMPIEPAAYGHTLETHAQVWNAALELLKKDLDLFSEARVTSALGDAERRLKVRIEEPALRKGMVMALTQCVAPTLLWQKLMAEIADTRLVVQLWGSGWPEEASIKATPLGGLAERAAICRRAKVVIHVDPSGSATLHALLGAGSGAVLLARAEPHHRLPGGLATLLEPGKEMLAFTSGRELLAQAKRLLSDTAMRTQIAGRGIARCGAEHSPSTRLQALLSAVRRRPSARPS